MQIIVLELCYFEQIQNYVVMYFILTLSFRVVLFWTDTKLVQTENGARMCFRVVLFWTDTKPPNRRLYLYSYVLELCYFEQIQNALRFMRDVAYVLELCYFEQIQNQCVKK